VAQTLLSVPGLAGLKIASPRGGRLRPGHRQECLFCATLVLGLRLHARLDAGGLPTTREAQTTDNAPQAQTTRGAPLMVMPVVIRPFDVKARHHVIRVVDRLLELVHRHHHPDDRRIAVIVGEDE
jgi:hypothetical protein